MGSQFEHVTGVISDKGLCPLGSRDVGSFVTVKLDPLPFWVGDLYHGTPDITRGKQEYYIIRGKTFC